MIDFHEIAEGLYTVHLNGVRITSEPLTKEEMTRALEDLKLSDTDVLFIERFYGSEI